MVSAARASFAVLQVTSVLTATVFDSATDARSAKPSASATLTAAIRCKVPLVIIFTFC